MALALLGHMLRPITIQAVLNGFVVTVGCQTVVMSSVAELCSNLAMYLTDPEGTEKNFAQHPNAKHTLLANQVVPAQQAYAAGVNEAPDAYQNQEVRERSRLFPSGR